MVQLAILILVYKCQVYLSLRKIIVRRCWRVTRNVIFILNWILLTKADNKYKDRFLVSRSLLFCFTLIIHRLNPPLPLPIREFLDFLVNGKLVWIKNQTLYLFLVNTPTFFFFKKNLKNFFKNLKYNDSTKPAFEKSIAESPYIIFLTYIFFRNRCLKLLGSFIKAIFGEKVNVEINNLIQHQIVYKCLFANVY